MTAEDGSRVLNKKNTWKHIYSEVKIENIVIADKGCDFGKDFVESKTN